MVLTKEVRIPLYDGYLAILIADEEVEISKHYDDLGTDLVAEFAHAQKVNVKKNGKSRAAYLSAFNISNRYEKITSGVIAHEAFHVVCFICDRHGIDLDGSSEEAYAYLMTWVTNEIHKFFNQKNIEIHLK